MQHGSDKEEQESAATKDIHHGTSTIAALRQFSSNICAQARTRM
jgi:hypothetical protein